jgi:SulP family sulfate permease
MSRVIHKIIPAFEWLRHYKRADLRGDLPAGFVVAIMLVPQGMAYAMLAGLPPVVGLYASTVPLLVYALFGSSRQLAVGPVAMISLLVFAGISDLAEPGSKQYLGLVLLLALIVGVTQFAMGLFRVGALIHFLSHAVITGFTSAAALIIILSQLNQVLGIKTSGGHSALHLFTGIVQKMGETNLTALILGSGSIALLMVVKKKSPRFPAPILVVAASIGATSVLGLDRLGVSIVGHVPRGFPAFTMPSMDIESLQALFPTALTVLFVGFMESFSIAKWVAAREKYKIDSNKELIGLGLANMAASFFSSYPVTGGLSRTAVNYEAGARTGLASIFSVLIILVTLTYFTSIFYYLPNAALAAIVIVAVIGLIDVKEARHLFRVKRIDGWTMMVTFLTTLLLGSQNGMIAGVGFSLLIFIWRSAHPHAAELGYLEKEGIFRNIKRFPGAKTYPQILILRVDASLYFANMNFLEDLLRKNLEEKKSLKWVVLDLSGVNDMDGVAIDALEGIMEMYRYRGIQFLFAAMKGPVRDLVAKAGWEEKYEKQIRPNTLQAALKEIQVEM